MATTALMTAGQFAQMSTAVNEAADVMGYLFQQSGRHRKAQSFAYFGRLGITANKWAVRALRSTANKR